MNCIFFGAYFQSHLPYSRVRLHVCMRKDNNNYNFPENCPFMLRSGEYILAWRTCLSSFLCTFLHFDWAFEFGFNKLAFGTLFSLTHLIESICHRRYMQRRYRNLASRLMVLFDKLFIRDVSQRCYHAVYQQTQKCLSIFCKSARKTPKK